MMSKITGFANAHVFWGLIIRFLMFIVLAVISGFQDLIGQIRTKLKFRTEQSKIFELKNSYKGERCFVICTGPSLTIDDLNLLKDEYTFAMNSIFLLLDKTTFRPSFYGCIDEEVFEKMKDNIFKYESDIAKVFISGRIRKHLKVLSPHWYNVSCNVAYHTYDRWFKNRFWCRFSGDAVFGTYDMYSVTHFLIQIAVYMGFKDIYLIGADCNQRVGKQVHFMDYGIDDRTLDTSRERNICGYEEIKRNMSRNNFSVYNATRGGELDVFERVNLDDLLSPKTSRG